MSYSDIYQQVKTFTDMNGKKGKIGDYVRIFDFYEKKDTGRVIQVIGGHKQGINGTILHFNEPPILEYPSNKNHVANCVVVVKK